MFQMGSTWQCTLRQSDNDAWGISQKERDREKHAKYYQPKAQCILSFSTQNSSCWNEEAMEEYQYYTSILEKYFLIEKWK